MENLALKFKACEVFSGLRLPPIPFFIRVDGRGFRKLLTELGFSKPYDVSFAKLMVESAKSVYEGGFNPALIYLFSDELNILFLKENIFSRRLEKIVSVIASLVSSTFSLKLLEIKGVRVKVAFDARAVIVGKEGILDYLIWRQNEAWRNCLNSYAYYSLLSKGLKPQEAHELLKGLKASQLHELIFRETGINVAKVPSWQRKGILIYKEVKVRKGYDPVKKVRVKALRKIIKEDWDPPLFEKEGRVALSKILSNVEI
ncbi:MAG: tRNA 5'-guanylyltransferase [Thermofilum sp. ex4484_15]|nr:MAG: tRNA 5'-guanylyltransferase [Thermofilum sp. ex4484_15]